MTDRIEVKIKTSIKARFNSFDAIRYPYEVEIEVINGKNIPTLCIFKKTGDYTWVCDVTGGEWFLRKLNFNCSCLLDARCIIDDVINDVSEKVKQWSNIFSELQETEKNIFIVSENKIIQKQKESEKQDNESDIIEA